MTEARVYLCPNCGAPSAERARRCDHCSAPIATLRCARCFGMNVPDARHCWGCGAELGLEAWGPHQTTSERRCPDCRVSLEAFADPDGALLDCAHCGGQFVEHRRLRAMLERREQFGRALPRRIKPRNPLSQ